MLLIKLTVFACAMTLLLSLAGCGDEGSSSGSSDATMDDLKKDAAQTMDTAGDMVAQTKDQAVAAAKKQWDGLKAQYDKLEAKAADASDGAKARYQKLKANLDTQMAKAEDEWKELQDASADTWQQTKSKLGDTMDAFAAKLEEAAESLKGD